MTLWTGENLNRPDDVPMMSQKERILLAFTAYGVVCGTTFLNMHIPAYSQRIGQLKGDGHMIDRATCPYSHHTHGKQIATYEYKGKR